MDNKDDLNELLDRAQEDADSNDDSVALTPSQTEEETVDKVAVNSDFSGYFHERDRLDHNNIVDEVKTSFMEYSMSVIKSRALPDLRDGLKPVHRRILWSMYESATLLINLIVSVLQL